MKVSYSLIAVGAVGLESHLSWAQLMKGIAHPSPFAALLFHDSKMYSFNAGLIERVFQSSHGDAKP